MQNGGGDRPIPRFVRVIITAYYLVSRKELQRRQNGVFQVPMILKILIISKLTKPV